MNRPAFGLALFVGLTLVVLPGCSARSIVIGGDPLGDGEGAAGGTSGVSSGGTLSSGGSGAGGSASASNGGTIPIGGASTSSGGSTSQGGVGSEGVTGDMIDPYPRVSWEEGQGYRRSCPNYDGTWGFTCWNHESGTTSGCRPTGDPYCNACMCAVPCETGDDCPRGITGHEADCIASATTTPSCFLVCDDGPCPTGMECTKYPGADRFVCMWLSEPPFGQPPV